MIHLFAALPASGRITAEHTHNCAKLSREWQYYVSKSKSLRKVFVSVKGVYFQAEILGETVTWLVPHSFTQSLPKEVDFRVMMTFLEFYEVYMKFVLFKLYHLKGWQYPPKVDPKLEAEGCCLLSMKAEEQQQSQETQKDKNNALTTANNNKRASVDPKTVTKLDLSTILSEGKNKNNKKEEPEQEDEDDDEEEEDEQDISVPLQSAFSDLQSFTAGKGDHTDFSEENKVFSSNKEEDHHNNNNKNNNNSSLLFSHLVFFVNREVPLDWLQLCITGFGGKIGWDGPLSPIQANDSRVTHQIIDRPLQSNSTLSREYIQPQWVFDSINAKLLLPARLYGPGVKLPPHLSPFVDDEKEGYLPKFREEIKKLQGGKGGDDDQKNKEEEGEESEEEQEQEEDFQATLRKEKEQRNKNSKNNNKKNDSEDEEENEEDESEVESAEELEELPPARLSSGKKGPKAIVYQKEEKELDKVKKNAFFNKTMNSEMGSCCYFYFVFVLLVFSISSTSFSKGITDIRSNTSHSQKMRREEENQLFSLERESRRRKWRMRAENSSFR
jgi:pescadillo protein